MKESLFVILGMEPTKACQMAPSPTSPSKSQQAKQMDDDALALMNDTPLIVPGKEGLRDIRVVEAIYQSAAKE